MSTSLYAGSEKKISNLSEAWHSSLTLSIIHRSAGHNDQHVSTSQQHRAVTCSRTTGVGSYMIALVLLQLAGSRPPRGMPFSKVCCRSAALSNKRRSCCCVSQSGAIKLQHDGLIVTAVYSPRKTDCTESKLSYRSQGSSSSTFSISLSLCVYVLFLLFLTSLLKNTSLCILMTCWIKSLVSASCD